MIKLFIKKCNEPIGEWKLEKNVASELCLNSLKKFKMIKNTKKKEDFVVVYWELLQQAEGSKQKSNVLKYVPT